MFLLSWQLAVAAVAFDFNPEKRALLGAKPTNSVVLEPGPNDATITRLTARILERQHYLRQPLDDEISSRFLDSYLDALDHLHLYLLQSDVEEFEVYRAQLDDLVKDGDTTPSRVIFKRFLERLEQQYDYVMDLLQNEKFDFTSDDRFLPNRHTLPRPKNLDEAKQLWRDRIRYEYLQEKLNKEKPDEIVKIVARRYTRVLRALKEYDNDDVLQIYLTALTHVYDPHSEYFGKSELETFSIGMKLSLYGIGALLRSEDGYCKVERLVAGGPAERSRAIKANDRIIAVAQGSQAPVDVVDMKLNKVVDLIRGPKDTEVRLTLIPADALDPSVRKTISLTRDEIKLEEQEAKAKIFELPVEKDKVMRLGLIDLPSFYSGFELEGRKSNGEQKSTTADVVRLLHKLIKEQVSGIILDLRRNGGGSLEEAINLTGLFIKDGPVVQIKEPDGKIFVDNDLDPTVAYDGPLIVLTSRFSASASEILAGALQDYDRALIVGDSSTHGKGTVQSLTQLAPILRSQLGLSTSNNPGAVKITIRKFYRASGSSTQLKGVTPDIVLPSIWDNHPEIGEAALTNALRWDTIPSATYEKLNRIEPYLAGLKKRSEARIATNRDFVYLRGEIERYQKSLAEKTISLNEGQRLKEKKEADERLKLRKKELAARPEPEGKVYELTLKQVDLPGLPPPAARTNHFASGQSTNAIKMDELVKKDETKGKPTQSEAAATGQGRGAKKSSEKTSPDGDEADDESADDQAPALDFTLDETKRILADFINLSGKPNLLAVTQSAATK
jgi:carboxyl-terminal processing protease